MRLSSAASYGIIDQYQAIITLLLDERIDTPMKKLFFLVTVITAMLLLGGVALAAHPCDMCGSAETSLVGSGAWCHWYCEKCDYTTSRNHDPNSYNSGLVPDSCSGHCRWCGASANYSSHTFTTWHLNSDVTCTTDGSETAHCDNVQCSATNTRHAPGSALGHDYAITVHRPMCENIGYTNHQCIRCEDYFNDQIVPPTGHDYAWSYNGDGTHTSACRNLGCQSEMTTSCSPMTTIVGGQELSICTVCGHRISLGDGSSMETAPNAGAHLDVTELPGELTVFVDAAPLDVPMDTDAFYMFITSLQKDGVEVSFSGRVEITIDLNEHPFSMPDSIFFEMPPSELKAKAFKIVRVEYQMVNGQPTEVWVEVPFTLKKGILTFETEKMGVFLMVLSIVEAPTAN